MVSVNRRMLLPGMRAEVEFTSKHFEDVVRCPNEAIRPDLQGNLGVYIPNPDALPNEPPFTFVPCKIGLTDGINTHVTAGLEEGTIVYTRLPVWSGSDNNK